MLLFTTGVLAGAAPQSFAQADTNALTRLESESTDERRSAADAVVTLAAPGLNGIDAVARRLSELRRGVDEQVANLMNKLLRGSDGTAKARSGPDARANDIDILELLVQQKPDLTVERALATVCLMRALARIGTTPAVRQLVPMASASGGAFRYELSRELKLLDDRATAALIEARGDSSFEIRAWAKDAIEALGKRTPGDSVQTTNDQVLVDVLLAYASIRDLDALSVVLSFVNSERTQVRAAARAATLAFGPDALGKLHATYAALTGERLADTMDATAVAHNLFDAYDRYRLRDVYARLDRGLANQRLGDIDGAIADFDNVLAHQPMLDRKTEIAPAYLAYAKSLEPTDRARAMDYLRRAARLEDAPRDQDLDNAGGSKSAVWSEIHYLEGEELLARGLVDTVPFERALALDPMNAHARSRLEGLCKNSAAQRTREDRIAVGVGAAGVAIIAVGLLAIRIPRRRVPR